MRTRLLSPLLLLLLTDVALAGGAPPPEDPLKVEEFAKGKDPFPMTVIGVTVSVPKAWMIATQQVWMGLAHCHALTREALATLPSQDVRRRIEDFALLVDRSTDPPLDVVALQADLHARKGAPAPTTTTSKLRTADGGEGTLTLVELHVPLPGFLAILDTRTRAGENVRVVWTVAGHLEAGGADFFANDRDRAAWRARAQDLMKTVKVR